MAYQLDDKLVIGLASSALFDLSESDNIFQTKGEAEYRAYQKDNQDVPLGQGVAFPLIRRMLSLNSLNDDEEPLVEVILLSQNDPDTGLRVMNSIEHYNLGITRAVFLQGESPHKYIQDFNIVLFLSANADNVAQAVKAGHPAGQILGKGSADNPNDRQLRIAFDFDGVIADDESERVYQENQDLDEFHKHETGKETIPHKAGPLKCFLERIAKIQQIEEQRLQIDKNYQPLLKIIIVTARSAPSHKRVINTMRQWNINVNQAFFLGGIEKYRVLKNLDPHIYFDDQKLHLKQSKDVLPCVHVPFGVTNKN